ncbi:hypothetical protein [Acinetobacter johnsonii]|nr:hypothetical protein [Acinetobacter johnsonii]
MEIQNEKEAFERFKAKQIGIDYETLKKDLDDCEKRFPNNRYAGWNFKSDWELWQAANAVAVPEGYVLVKKVHPDAIVHNQGLGLFKECQIIYGWDGKSKDFKDALNKGFYHGVKLGAKAVLETAMIEAQEPAND